VQAGEYLNFLGLVDVTFNKDGVVTGHNGQLVTLSTYAEDAAAKEKVEEYKVPLEEIKNQAVGNTSVELNGKRADVRTKETNLGNLIADGMVAKANESVKTHIALQNGGGIRESINSGEITLGEVLTVLPFGNNLVTLDLTGQEILDALEHSVSGVETGEGRFLQVSGIKFKYDITKPAGDRVWFAEAKTDNGFEAIDANQTYRVATNAFTADGGDGYTMFKKAKDEGRMTELFVVDYEVFTSYLAKNNPVSPVVEGRIIQETEVTETPVKRIKGKNRYETAVEVSKSGWETAKTVVLARGDSFPDALAGAPLAYKLNAPILLTEKGSLNRAAKEEIKRLGAEKAVILGGTGAVSDYVKYQLNGMDLKVQRIGGDNRFETAANIAAVLGGAPEKAIIANGRDFPDALSIASYAALKGYPVLLTDSKLLPAASKKALKNIDSTIVVGGEAAVNAKVFKQLENPERYYGKNRYGTAAAIATELNPSNKVFIATGEDFADALAGSVLAAKENASMLLVKPKNIPSETEAALEAIKADEFNVLGGENAVSEEIVNQLKK
jgi:putative cell wall-binding protein